VTATARFNPTVAVALPVCPRLARAPRASAQPAALDLRHPTFPSPSASVGHRTRLPVRRFETLVLPASLGINNAWLVVYGYAVQLLADFWGYSTMAVGLALCFGFVLPVNFENPYGSASLREFWRRWHITLSVWLRDYLYISLGGNRGVSKTRAAFNRLLTMALGGLWHGPGWNFILWGALHGVWMDLELLTEKSRARWPKWLGVLITFHVVVFLWVPFRAPSMDKLGVLVGRLFTAPWDISTPTQTLVMTVGFLALQKPLFSLVRGDRPETLRPWLELALAAVMVWLLLAYGSARADFIYYVF
jgi:hypothetical protein